MGNRPGDARSIAYQAGRATDEQRAVYDVVRQANELAAGEVRVGLRGREADALARDYIERCGYGEEFGHGLGHGLGIEVHEAPSMPFDIPGMGGQVGVLNLTEMMGKAFGQTPGKRRKLKVPDAFARLTEEEADKRLDPDDINRVALSDAESNAWRAAPPEHYSPIRKRRSWLQQPAPRAGVV